MRITMKTFTVGTFLTNCYDVSHLETNEAVIDRGTINGVK
jgi:hypothetical protein